jgi:hypothetical protein
VLEVNFGATFTAVELLPEDEEDGLLVPPPEPPPQPVRIIEAIAEASSVREGAYFMIYDP